MSFRWLFMSIVLSACSFGAQSRSSQWLADMRQAHERADAHVKKHDPAGAVRELRAALASDEPSIDIRPEHRRQLRQDTYFRVVVLETEQLHLDEAISAATAGLAEKPRGRDLFTANLLVARAKAEEKKAALNPEIAHGLERSAAGDYYEALRINEDLMKEVLHRDE